ncbi:MAG: tetratricopeptide repeat protein [candidate division WOR-3 bacterium]
MKNLIFIVLILVSINIFSLSDLTETEKSILVLDSLTFFYLKSYDDIIEVLEPTISDEYLFSIYSENFKFGALFYVGASYFEKENYEKAKKYLKQAKQYEDGSSFLISHYYYYLGNLEESDKNYYQALDYYKKSKKYFYQFDDQNERISFVLFYIGQIYLYNVNNYDSAIVYFENSLEFDKKMLSKTYKKDPRKEFDFLAYDYSRLGESYFYNKSYEKAKKNLFSAMQIGEKFPQEYSFNAFNYYLIARVFYGQYNYDSALVYFKKSLDNYKSIDSKKNVINLYDWLGLTYEQKYDKKQARESYYQAYINAKDFYGEYNDLTKKLKEKYEELSGSSSSYSYQDYSSSSGFRIKDEGFFVNLDYMRSVGRNYFGGGLGVLEEGGGVYIGYYFSPAKEGETFGKYLPIVMLSGYQSFSLEFSCDLISLFDFSNMVNKSMSKPRCFGFGFSFGLLKFLNVKTQYFWSGGGGYSPKGLSINCGFRFFM